MAARNDWRDAHHASWAVADASDRLVGSVSLHKIDWDQADAEVGFWIAPWARRQSQATRSVVVASRFGFTQLGLHRVYLCHAVENFGSCGVARAAGFVLEGAPRQSFRYPDGVYHDEHLHALLSSDVDLEGCQATGSTSATPSRDGCDHGTPSGRCPTVAGSSRGGQQDAAVPARPHLRLGGAA